MRTRDFFDYAYLERAGELRAESGWLEAVWSDPRSRRDKELESARWVSREELADQTVLPPPAISIATPLIESWFDAGWPRPLRELLDETLWGPWF